jgi:hypothetical protein
MIAEGSARAAVAAVGRARGSTLPKRIIGMKWTRLALAFLAPLVVCLAPAIPGSLPNFSGTWQADKSRSTVQSSRPFASLATQMAVTMVIDHREPELKIEEHGSLALRERTVVTVYYTDGRETSNRGARGEAITSRSHWEKDTLVTDSQIVRGTGANARTMTRHEVMSLSEDGKTLVLDGTRTMAGEDKPESVHLVFVKK